MAQFDRLLNVHSMLSNVSATSNLYEGTDALVDNGPLNGYVRSRQSTVAAAWVYYGAVHLTELAQLIGRRDDATRIAAQAAAMKKAMNAVLWDSVSGGFCDGPCANASLHHRAFHSTIHPLAFGAVDDAHVQPAWEYTQQKIDPVGGMPCGPYPSQFAVRALFANERDSGHAAIKLLTHSGTNSWRGMLALGATMSMEMWNETM